jgi:hypothetical protein
MKFSFHSEKKLGVSSGVQYYRWLFHDLGKIPAVRLVSTLVGSHENAQDKNSKLF